MMTVSYTHLDVYKRQEQTGSEKKYSFCIPPERETKRVVVYEACIDALAHMKMCIRDRSPVPESIPTEWKLCGTGIGQ